MSVLGVKKRKTFSFLTKNLKKTEKWAILVIALRYFKYKRLN